MYLCPRCNGSLITNSSEAVDFEVCGDCGGIWLDADELRVLAGKARSEAENCNDDNSNGLSDLPSDEAGNGDETPSGDVGAMKCPKCTDSSLKAFVYAMDSGIELDRCHKCSGLWLDKNELEQIAAYMIKSDNCPMAQAFMARKKEEGFLSRYSEFFSSLSKFFLQNAKRRYR